ncbi:unnamed protein product [Hymenolepis diminuta]|nr:unnamed protein product [Hymenolepis diminuta]
MRKKRKHLIGNKLRKMPIILERASSNNGSTKEIDGNLLNEQCSLKLNPTITAGDLENGTEEIALKNEKNRVSEIWKNRLNSAGKSPLPSPQPSLPSIVLVNNSLPTNNKVNKLKWPSLKKIKIDQNQNRRISNRGFKGNGVLQNMKTAGMLFVVAIVYIIALIPALLMAANLIHIYLPVFYMYYVNNAINPIIYCFVNPAFREDVQNFFISRFRNLRKVH